MSNEGERATVHARVNVAFRLWIGCSALPSIDKRSCKIVGKEVVARTAILTDGTESRELYPEAAPGCEADKVDVSMGITV